MLLHSMLMNALHNHLGRKILALIDKRIFLLLGLLLAMALPVLTNQIRDELQNLSVIEDKLTLARKNYDQKQAYLAKVRDYQDFASEVRRFLRDSQKARILKHDWIIYEVDIKDRLVDMETMRTFLDNAKSNERFYFLPKTLQVTSLFAKQLLPPEILKILADAASAPPPQAPMINPMSEEPAPPQAAPEKMEGNQVLLTLKGTYMVKRP